MVTCISMGGARLAVSRWRSPFDVVHRVIRWCTLVDRSILSDRYTSLCCLLVAALRYLSGPTKWAYGKVQVVSDSASSFVIPLASLPSTRRYTPGMCIVSSFRVYGSLERLWCWGLYDWSWPAPQVSECIFMGTRGGVPSCLSDALWYCRYDLVVVWWRCVFRRPSWVDNVGSGSFLAGLVGRPTWQTCLAETWSIVHLADLLDGDLIGK
jgi:hypothetical protein